MRIHPYLRCAGRLGLLPLFCLALRTAEAGSATWNLNPTSGDWNTATNWTPATVPNGPSDTGTFDVSSTTDVSISADTEVNGIAFNPGASPFTLSVSPNGASTALTITGVGITNNSAITQNFVADQDVGRIGLIIFMNSATAGNSTVLTNKGSTLSDLIPGGTTQFFGGSSAGHATITNLGGRISDTYGGWLEFYDTSTAGNANVNLRGGVGNGSFGGFARFLESATAGRGKFTASGGTIGGASGAIIQLMDTSNAENGVFVTNGGAGPGSFGAQATLSGAASAGHGRFTTNGATAIQSAGGNTMIGENATAADATFTCNAGAVNTAGGGFTGFYDNATAANAVFTLNGASIGPNEAPGGGFLQFNDTTTAANARLVANGGTTGGLGGIIQFVADSTGGTAQVSVNASPTGALVFGNGSLDISAHNPPGLTTGSIVGSGDIFLGSVNLTVGSNNRSTTFSGVIQDGGLNGGTGGSLTKIGAGRLTLSNANTYTGGTLITGGTLLVANTTGSATGTGPVQVTAGVLGGIGKISGSVAVASGPTAAILAPGSGNKVGTLFIQSTLIFNSPATCQVVLNSNTLKGDKVVAVGVTINSGALISISDLGSTALAPGTIFFLISNTAATPIAGTFSNLADGSMLTVGSNTFLASYEGGDGNDLTLIVVP